MLHDTRVQYSDRHGIYYQNGKCEITSNENLIPFSCGNEEQAIIWLLRNSANSLGPETFKLNFPNNNKYEVLFWITISGNVINETTITDISKGCTLPPFEKDVAIYLRRI